MRNLRLIMKAGLSGGAVAVFLAYTLFLQGLLTAYGQAAMAGQSPDDLAFVICSPLGGSPSPADTDRRFGHDCCSGLCHSTCRGAPGMLGNNDSLLIAYRARPAAEPGTVHAVADIGEQRRLAEARAPPVFI